MSSEISASRAIATPMPRHLDFFERFLTLWVFLCMIVGVAAGALLPAITAAIGQIEFVKGSHVNAPIAVLIWLMIYPMMLKIDFGGIRSVFARPKGLFITLFVNWLVKPTILALLATLVLIFAFQAGNILSNWIAVLLLAVPILIQVYFNSSLTYMLMRITLFGPTSPAALATVVGVLVEVPVMLSVCKFCVRSKPWYERAVAAGRSSKRNA